MFNPSNLDALPSWGDVDLRHLPAAEDERHEYKSSATADGELVKKIGRAASAFWNSGGGLFVAGVDGRGQPDGGLDQMVNRQSRRDWLDQAIGTVSPQGRYIVHSVEDRGAGLKIESGKAVYLIGFGESEVGPHMAPDNKYYIRGGAHTVPAGHFIVEAIHARRGLKRPMLRSILRRKPDGGGIIQLGIVALTEAPALDVEIDVNPPPSLLQNAFKRRMAFQIAVINAQLPFFFDVHLSTSHSFEPPPFTLHLKYRDLAGRIYEDQATVEATRQIPPSFGGGHFRGIEDRLRDIERVLQRS
jgi:hypothetical protein